MCGASGVCAWQVVCVCVCVCVNTLVDVYLKCETRNAHNLTVSSIRIGRGRNDARPHMGRAYKKCTTRKL